MMNEARIWLTSREHNYQAGLRIYNQYKISNKHDGFLASVADADQNSVQHKILTAQMLKIERKIDAMAGREPDTPKKPITVKPIENQSIKTVRQQEIDLVALRENKLLVNKLLVMDWKKLGETDKAIFFNNEAFFMEKKEALIEISQLKNEMHLADAKRKSTRSQDARKKYNQAVNFISNKIKELFKKKIDNWTIPVNQNNDAAEAVRRERRIRYLEGTAIPRAKKELKSGKLDDERKELRVKNLKEWQEELVELRKIHNV
jgi:hypothetical protein